MEQDLKRLLAQAKTNDFFQCMISKYGIYTQFDDKEKHQIYDNCIHMMEMKGIELDRRMARFFETSYVEDIKEIFYEACKKQLELNAKTWDIENLMNYEKSNMKCLFDSSSVLEDVKKCSILMRNKTKIDQRQEPFLETIAKSDFQSNDFEFNKRMYILLLNQDPRMHSITFHNYPFDYTIDIIKQLQFNQIYGLMMYSIHTNIDCIHLDHLKYLHDISLHYGIPNRIFYEKYEGEEDEKDEEYDGEYIAEQIGNIDIFIMTKELSIKWCHTYHEQKNQTNLCTKYKDCHDKQHHFRSCIEIYCHSYQKPSDDFQQIFKQSKYGGNFYELLDFHLYPSDILLNHIQDLINITMNKKTKRNIDNIDLYEDVQVDVETDIDDICPSCKRLKQ